MQDQVHPRPEKEDLHFFQFPGDLTFTPVWAAVSSARVNVRTCNQLSGPSLEPRQCD